jgi:hypothetical protein
VAARSRSQNVTWRTKRRQVCASQRHATSNGEAGMARQGHRVAEGGLLPWLCQSTCHANWFPTKPMSSQARARASVVTAAALLPCTHAEIVRNDAVIFATRGTWRAQTHSDQAPYKHEEAAPTNNAQKAHSSVSPEHLSGVGKPGFVHLTRVLNKLDTTLKRPHSAPSARHQRANTNPRAPMSEVVFWRGALSTSPADRQTRMATAVPFRAARSEKYAPDAAALFASMTPCATSRIARSAALASHCELASQDHCVAWHALDTHHPPSSQPPAGRCRSALKRSDNDAVWFLFIASRCGRAGWHGRTVWSSASRATCRNRRRAPERRGYDVLPRASERWSRWSRRPAGDSPGRLCLFETVTSGTRFADAVPRSVPLESRTHCNQMACVSSLVRRGALGH